MVSSNPSMLENYFCWFGLHNEMLGPQEEGCTQAFCAVSRPFSLELCSLSFHRQMVMASHEAVSVDLPTGLLASLRHGLRKSCWPTSSRKMSSCQ
jgi:hypothetical protein